MSQLPLMGFGLRPQPILRVPHHEAERYFAAGFAANFDPRRHIRPRGSCHNVSLAFVDFPGVPGQASASSTVSLGTINGDIWQWTNDAFPANETAGLPGTAAISVRRSPSRTAG